MKTTQKTPEDSFWSIVTIPVRLVFVLLISVIAIPLALSRKVWAPHVPTGVGFDEVYKFVRYGAYTDDGTDWS